MTDTIERVQLPYPTSATSQGPIIEFRDAELRLKYDYISPTGTSLWIYVQFEDVLAFQVYRDPACEADQIVSGREMEEFKDSLWLRETINRWQQSVGWQEYQISLGGRDRFKHYKLYFDDVCSVQVIAAGYIINVTCH